MKCGKASWTAEVTAIYRAVETQRPAGVRLIDDPYAGRFLRAPFRLALKNPPLARLALWMAVECRFPGGYDTIVARIRCVDDALRRALAKGIQQVVILGAGFDARSYRFEEMRRVNVFEVDHPLTQWTKKKRLEKIFGRLPGHVTYVPIDFEIDSLETLARHGYDARLATFFVWEGVVKYLTTEAVAAVLSWIATHSPAGSRVIFDYLLKAMVEGRWPAEFAQRALKYQRRKGEPFLFGIAPQDLSPWLEQLGYASVARISAAELKSRYLTPLHRGKRLHDFIEIAGAVV